MSTFNNRNTAQKCALKDCVWDLTDRNLQFTIKWDIIKRSTSYLPGQRNCRLCLDEKLVIMDSWEDTLLVNNDPMIMRPCLHKYFFKLSCWNKSTKKNTGNPENG